MASSGAAEMVLRLQRLAGNAAVARSMQRSGVSLQRHSAAALDAQIKAAELGEEVPEVQRRGVASAERTGTAVQRHALPRNRRFSADAVPSESAVRALKAIVVAEMPRIVTHLKGTIAPKTPNPADAERILIPQMVIVMDAPNVGLGPPAAAEGEKFSLMVRSPYLYMEDGQPDADFLKAVLVHEAMHCLSFNHTGLQTADFLDATGATRPVGSEAANDSLDEAVTEQLSQDAYNALYPMSPYKTNYWQGIRSVGVHATTNGLKALGAKARAYAEKNWTGGLADLVVSEGVMTKGQLEQLYLKGPNDPANQAQAVALRDRYRHVLRLWYEQKDKAWQKDLPPGVITAQVWVERLDRALAGARTQKFNADEAAAEVATVTGGHRLVGPDDPRSHLYNVPSKRHPDDFEILRRYYPAAAPSVPHPADPGEPAGWKGSPLKQVRGRYPEATLRDLAKAQAARVGLKPDDYPQIVVPDQRTLGSTKFDQYPSKLFNPKLPDIRDRTMAQLSPGVEPDASAQQIVLNMGGGAYETGGKVVYANSIEPRTLLHEIGHYKQDEGNLNEVTINAKLLEYHNVITIENTYDDAPVTADRKVRLTYTTKPMVMAQGSWDAVLGGVPAGAADEPPTFALLKQVASVVELGAITAIESTLLRAKGADGLPLYTPKMRWYAKQQLATEYFKASRSHNL